MNGQGTPYQQNIPVATQSMATEFKLTIPANKRLVIETVTALVALPVGQKSSVDLVTHDLKSNYGAVHHLVLFYQYKDSTGVYVAGEGPPPPLDIYTANHPMLVYTDSDANGIAGSFWIRRDGMGEAHGRFSISGYLIDIP